MAVDMFLKLAGIKGESHDHKHKDEIEVLSFSFGASQSVSHGSGGGAGKVSFQDFRIVKNVDSASPDLFDAVCAGKHIQEGTLTVRKAGHKESVDFYKVSFEDVLISSVGPGGTSNELPMEQVSLNFAGLKVEARRQRADGSFGPWETTRCDLAGDKT
jgi:type VI secretion system secreted protein Hcp